MKCIFDTMVLVSWHMNNGELPEKWKRAWDSSAYHGNLLVTELLISEVYFQVARKDGYASALNSIMKIKGLNGTVIYQKDDVLAVEAARYRYESVLQREDKKRGSEISLTDAYLIAISKKENAKIFTSDIELRNSARDARGEVDFIPESELIP